MPNFRERLDRAYDLSAVRDKRYKEAAMVVDSRNEARLNAELCEAVIEANSAHGGRNPVPYGVYVLPGDLSLVKDPPAELQGVQLLEFAPADVEDPRAARLTWNAIGTQATFQFTPVANLLNIEPPENSSMRVPAYVLTDVDGLPIILLPLGEGIKLEGSGRRQVAAGREPAAGSGTAGAGDAAGTTP